MYNNLDLQPQAPYHIKRGEVFLADFTSENQRLATGTINKVRPCIVVSDDTYNDMFKNIIVLPLSTQLDKYPGCVTASIEPDKVSAVIINNMQGMNRANIKVRSSKGILKPDKMEEIDLKLINTLGLEYLMRDQAEIDELMHQINTLKSTVDDLKEKNAKLSNELSLRNKQLKMFSNRKQENTHPARQPEAKKPEVNQTKKHEQPEVKKPEVNQTKKHEQPEVKKPEVNQTGRYNRIEGYLYPDYVKSSWNEEECKGFLAYCNDKSIKMSDVMELYKIRTISTYYRIQKECIAKTM